MDGIDLAIRFSYIVNNLEYCGPGKQSDAFLQYAKKKDNSQEIKSIFKKFEGLYPYLKSIADKHNKDFLDYDVVEAYWLGNNLLDDITKDDIKEILDHLAKRGLPPSLANQLKDDLPVGIVANHNFHVFYVGPGNTAHTVNPALLSTRDNCRISTGRIVEIYKDTLLVQTNLLKHEDGNYVLGEETTRTVVYIPDMLGPIKKNDVIAIHWGFACLVLSKEQQSNLKKYTDKVMRAIHV